MTQYRNIKWSCQPRVQIQVDGLVRNLLALRCLLCGRVCPGSNICTPCLGGLPRNRDACQACGLPCASPVDGRCGRCASNPPPWNSLWAPLRYEFPVDRLIGMLKFRRNLAAGRALTHAMLSHGVPPVGTPRRLLIPVPLHWTRQAARGFNQAVEMARHLARPSGDRLITGHLLRTQRTPPQLGLDAAQRRRNLGKAFRWRGNSLQGAGVILVDDVMTTGSTIAACTAALRSAGAGRVGVWVAARAV